MYFLIDYENVTNGGMQGTAYLQPEDHIIVFYSASAPTMESQHLTAIKDSGCAFEICRLIKARKNGLDFYIATRLGAILGEGYRGNIAIISRDDGFQAVREFWASRAVPARRVLLSDSIERSIISANETGNPRTLMIQQRLKTQDIGNFYSAYTESRKLKRLLSETFAGTEFSGRTAEMEDILRSGKTAKVIYLDTLRRFGRKNGLTVYQKLKGCVDL